MHSSRMRTARSSSRPGGLHQAPPREQASPRPKQAPPGSRHPPGADPPRTRPPIVNRMTHRCKNITLLQTSFAGGKYGHILYTCNQI